METANLVYHFSVIIISFIIFFMKISSPYEFVRLIFVLLAKLVPLFCMVYASVNLFKIFGII